MSMLQNLPYLYTINKVNTLLEKYPFMTKMQTCIDCNPDNGWQFIEYRDFIDKQVNEEFLSLETRNKGFRLLKTKLLGSEPDKITKKDGFSYKYVKIGEKDTFTLDMNDEDINNGFRFIKIKVASLHAKKGWLTQSEIDDGWKIFKKTISRHYKKQTKRPRKNIIYNHKKVKKTDSETMDETMDETMIETMVEIRDIGLNKENEHASFVINSL